MRTSTTISSAFVALLSIITSCGVAIYDGQFTRLAAESISGVRAANTVSAHDSTDISIGHTQHVHSDYNPVGSMLNNSFHYQSPSIAPRRRSHHKELLRILEIGSGRHAFDDVNLPMIS
jgi:hypothetical protein